MRSAAGVGHPEQGGSIAVIGGALIGMATAARLARAGHDVTLYEASDSLGGRWIHPAAWPGSIMVPAAWRDLFRKTGKPLPQTLAAAGLDMIPSPPVRHILSQGAVLDLPTDRGEQHRTLAAGFGRRGADAWRDLVDHLDETWQLLRPLGFEADDECGRTAWHDLDPRTSVAEMARRLPGYLRELYLDTVAPDDPAQVPAFMATLPSQARTFGRWQLIRIEDRAMVPPSELTRLLIERVAERGVEVCTHHTVTARDAHSVTVGGRTRTHRVVIDTTHPWSGLAHPPYRLIPATAPTVTEEPCTTPEPETVDHLLGRRTWTYPRGDEWVRVVADHRRKIEDPGAGARAENAKAWRRRPTTTPGSDGVVHASAANRAGGQPWAQILTAALAAYAAHERTGGRSIRPVDDPRKQSRRDDHP